MRAGYGNRTVKNISGRDPEHVSAEMLQEDLAQDCLELSLFDVRDYALNFNSSAFNIPTYDVFILVSPMVP